MLCRRLLKIKGANVKQKTYAVDKFRMQLPVLPTVLIVAADSKKRHDNRVAGWIWISQFKANLLLQSGDKVYFKREFGQDVANFCPTGWGKKSSKKGSMDLASRRGSGKRRYTAAYLSTPSRDAIVGNSVSFVGDKE